MSNPPPILLIHYGPARYLRWALTSARRTNPTARIVLLGDECNRQSARGLAEFYPFENFAGGELVGRLDKSFRVIQGERHRFTKLGGMETWLRFVFRRWFLLGEFLTREGIDSFWTFDSDTLFLGNLTLRAERFHSFDATCQCKGACLNGWVGSSELVHRYNKFTLGLFQDDAYLKSQVLRLKVDAGLAFNEMDAFSEFVRREGIRTFHAQESVDSEAFDDALAFVKGFEPAPEKVLGRTEVKRLWVDSAGRIFARRDDRSFVRLLTCNMSWMPDFLWKRLMEYRCSEDSVLPTPPVLSELTEFSYREPLIGKALHRFFTHLPKLKFK